MTKSNPLFYEYDLEFLAVAIVGALGLSGLISLQSELVSGRDDELLAAIQVTEEVLERELPVVFDIYVERKLGSVIVETDESGKKKVFYKKPMK